MKTRIDNLATLLIAMLCARCAVEPNNPGQCALNCSKAIIAGSAEYSIKLKNTVPPFECSKGLSAQKAFPGPVLIQFLVIENNTDGTPGLPVPYISFDPSINGLVAAERTHTENVQKYNAGDILPDGTQATTKTYYPYRYLGISTPKTNWCSDTCGVMSLEVVPVCPVAGTNNDVTVQVASGSLFSDAATIKITTPEND